MEHDMEYAGLGYGYDDGDRFEGDVGADEEEEPDRGGTRDNTKITEKQITILLIGNYNNTVPV